MLICTFTGYCIILYISIFYTCIYLLSYLSDTSTAIGLMEMRSNFIPAVYKKKKKNSLNVKPLELFSCWDFFFLITICSPPKKPLPCFKAEKKKKRLKWAVPSPRPSSRSLEECKLGGNSARRAQFAFSAQPWARYGSKINPGKNLPIFNRFQGRRGAHWQLPLSCQGFIFLQRFLVSPGPACFGGNVDIWVQSVGDCPAVPGWRCQGGRGGKMGEKEQGWDFIFPSARPGGCRVMGKGLFIS